MDELRLDQAVAIIDTAVGQLRLTRAEHAQVNAAMQVLVSRAQAAEALVGSSPDAPAAPEGAVVLPDNRAQRRASGRATPKQRATPKS